jgi:hypothetical protein
MPDGLVWEQPRALKKEFQLRRGSEVVASLRFPSLWSSRAQGSYGIANLILTCEGVFHRRARVASEGLDQVMAIARIGRWFGQQAEIELPTGRAYTLSSKGAFHRVWTLSEHDGVRKREMLTLVESRSFLRESGHFELGGWQASDPEPFFLALVVCYLVVVIHEQEGAVSATY